MGFLQRVEVKANFRHLRLFGANFPVETIELVLLWTLFKSLVAH